MKFFRDRGHIAGFRIQAEHEDTLPVREGGEIWAPFKWQIGWHANAGVELYLQAKGTSHWECEDGTRFHLRPGGFYLIHEPVRHRLRRFEQGDIHFFFVVFDRAELPGSLRRPPILHGSGGPGLRLPFEGLVRELMGNRERRPDACRLYLRLLCLELERRHDHTTLASAQVHPAALRAREYMESDLSQRWPLEELAALCGVSVGHLIEVMRNDFGRTPRQLLLDLRLEAARRQLGEPERTITQIAHDLGFHSSQHFARTCRQRLGKTPRQLRALGSA